VTLLPTGPTLTIRAGRDKGSETPSIEHSVLGTQYSLSRPNLFAQTIAYAPATRKSHRVRESGNRSGVGRRLKEEVWEFWFRP
jgi:hypothetical protein